MYVKCCWSRPPTTLVTHLDYDVFWFECRSHFDDEMQSALAVLVAENRYPDLVLGRRVRTTCCWASRRRNGSGRMRRTVGGLRHVNNKTWVNQRPSARYKSISLYTLSPEQHWFIVLQPPVSHQIGTVLTWRCRWRHSRPLWHCNSCEILLIVEWNYISKIFGTNVLATRMCTFRYI